MQGSVQRERPLGVTILAVLAIISGILGLLGGVALLGLGAAGLGGVAAIMGILVLVLAVLELAFGFGAWTLQPWAWTLGVASQVLSRCHCRDIAMGGSITGQIVGIIIAAVILYYLFTPPVRQAFGKA